MGPAIAPGDARRVRRQLRGVVDGLIAEFADEVPAGSVIRCVARCTRTATRREVPREVLAPRVERMARDLLASRCATS